MYIYIYIIFKSQIFKMNLQESQRTILQKSLSLFNSLPKKHGMVKNRDPGP